MGMVDGQHHHGTVGRCSLELLRGNHAAGTGFVFHNDRLVHDHAQFFTHDARDYIGRSPGWESHHNADRAVVIG